MPTQHDVHTARPTPPANSANIVCPYCGERQPPAGACVACKGVFEPLSRQASQNAMGPWQLRDEAHPFRPGCSYDTLRVLITRGRVTASSVLRGPTTNQFWTIATRVPGVAHLLGACHACGLTAKPADRLCQSCGAVFDAPNDRQRLGLAPMLPLDAVVADESGAARIDRPTAPGAMARPVTTAAAGTSPHVFEHFQHAPAPRSAGGRVGGRTALIGLLVVAPLVVAAAVTLRPALFPSPAAVEPDPTPIDPEPVLADLPEDGAAAAPDGPPVAADPGSGGQAGTTSEPGLHEILEGADEATPEGVQAALDRLRGLREETPADQRPAELDAEISRLERRLEELLLRRMLGSGPGSF